MKSIRGIITGVLSVVVLFTAVQIGTGQEQAVASTNKVEMMESVKAKVLAGTVEKLQLHVWTFDGGPTDSETVAANYSFGGSPGCPSGEQTVCQIQAPEDLTLPPGSPRRPDMSAAVGTTGQTVAQRIDNALSDEDPNETAISLKAN